jgi:hypothetical protein
VEEKVRALVVVPVSRDRAVVVGPVSGRADLDMVADLCRLLMLGERLGIALRVRVLCLELASVVALVGLSDLLVPDGPAADGAVLSAHVATLDTLRAHGAVGTTVLIEVAGHAEHGEEVGVEEIRPRRDATVVDLKDVQRPR